MFVPEPLLRKHFIRQSWRAEPRFVQPCVYRGWPVCSRLPYLFRSRQRRRLRGEAAWAPARWGAEPRTGPALPCPAGKAPAATRTRCGPGDFACQLYLDWLLPAVPTAAGRPLSRGMAAHGPAGPWPLPCSQQRCRVHDEEG